MPTVLQDRSWFGRVGSWVEATCTPTDRKQRDGKDGASSRDDEEIGIVSLSVPAPNGDLDRPNNAVFTCKYSWWSFLPRATMLQFRRFSNIFFLVVAIIGLIGYCIPQLFLVSYSPFGTLTILMAVVGITLIFEAKDDLSRLKADNATNSLPCLVLENGNFVKFQWGKLRAGQIIRINNFELVPADVLLLRSAHDNGKTCYVETSGIDGETNLKIKHVHPEMAKLVDVCPGGDLVHLSGRVIYEEPSPFLQFSGRFEPDGRLNDMVKYASDVDAYVSSRASLAQSTLSSNSDTKTDRSFSRESTTRPPLPNHQQQEQMHTTEQQQQQQQQHQQQQQQQDVSEAADLSPAVVAAREGGVQVKRHAVAVAVAGVAAKRGNRIRDLVEMGGWSLKKPTTDNTTVVQEEEEQQQQQQQHHSIGLAPDSVQHNGDTAPSSSPSITTTAPTVGLSKEEEVDGPLYGLGPMHESEDSDWGMVRESSSMLGSSAAVSLDYSNLVLRGSQIRNTAHVDAMVMYAGVETKLVASSHQTPSKFSLIDSFVNKTMGYTMMIYCMLVVMMDVVLLTLVPSTDSLWYFKFVDATAGFGLPSWLAFLFTFSGLFALLIPIDMYVCLELANVAQAYLIRCDAGMYDAVSDTCADIKTSNLVAEVGQVTHLLSDKTGTLTRNEMRLVSLSLWAGGELHNFGYQGVSGDDGPPNLYGALLFPTLAGAVSGDSSIKTGLHELLTILAVCHSVVIDQDDDGDPRYNAEGPDEEALVRGAASLGYALESTDRGEHVFTRRAIGSPSLTDSNSSLDQSRSEYVHERFRFGVLAVNEFSSDRKRMSMLVKKYPVELYNSHGPIGDSAGIQDDGETFLLVKGADNMVLERCGDDVADDAQAAKQAIEAKVEDYSQYGLRTLVMAMRKVKPREEAMWLKQYHTALACTGLSRKDQLNKVAETIERDLMVVGASAIEDALQEGVPETIRVLKRAGIKVWVLTGDKVGTAVNIAYSAQLLDNSMTELRLVGPDAQQHNTDIDRILNIIAHGYSSLALDNTNGDDKDNNSTDPAATSGGDVLRGLGNCTTGRRKTSRSDGSPELQSLLGFEYDTDDNDDGSIDTEEELRDAVAVRRMTSALDKLALVVSGDALSGILSSQKGSKRLEAKFMALADKCTVLLACRVSPKQKALLVDLVNSGACNDHGAKGAAPVTLAIGDGANDVPMIQRARVGVGISGKEGMQAANSADFTISQFRFLQRLLLVHGRWNYLRNARMVTYVAYSWQLVAYQVLFYSIISMLSGQSVYNNAFYLTLFAWVANSVIVAIAWTDRDISEELVLANPECYAISRTNEELDGSAVFEACLRAFIHAGIIANGALIALPYTTTSATLGSTVFTMVVLVLNARQIVLTRTFTWFVTYCFILAFAIFFAAMGMIETLIEGTVIAFTSMGGSLWIGAMWVVGSCVIADVLVFDASLSVMPDNQQILLELDRASLDGENADIGVLFRSRKRQKALLERKALAQQRRVGVASEGEGDALLADEAGGAWGEEQEEQEQDTTSSRVYSDLLRASSEIGSLRDLSQKSRSFAYSYPENGETRRRGGGGEDDEDGGDASESPAFAAAADDDTLPSISES